jgi:hypothetical protein
MCKRSIQIQEALYCGIDVSAKSLAAAVCHDLAALPLKREISPLDTPKEKREALTSERES